MKTRDISDPEIEGEILEILKGGTEANCVVIGMLRLSI